MTEQDRSEEISVATGSSHRSESLEFLENFESVQQDGFARLRAQLFFVKEGSEAHRKILDSSGKRLTYPLGAEVVGGVVYRRYQINESFFERLDKRAGDQT